MHFIIAANDSNKNFKTGLTALATAQRCVELGVWGFRNRSKYGGSLTEGDKLVIYIAGARKYSHSFFGIVECAGSCTPEPLTIGEITWPLTVKLRQIEVFPQPLPIRPLLARFQFVTNKKNWGVHLFGGGARISEADFNLICSEQKATTQPAK